MRSPIAPIADRTNVDRRSSRSILDPAMPRPSHVKPPAYLTPSPPVPEPEKVEPSKDDPLGKDPTRYGDWTLKGIAVDF